MQSGYSPIHVLLLLLTLFGVGAQAIGSSEVLVSVDELEISASDLEKALRSSPFATNFNTLDEKEQAFLRGGMLQRLVASRLLVLEAKKRGLDKSERFHSEVDRFRLGLLHRSYMEHLREGIKIPEITRQQMKEQFKDNRDALKAAESAYIADEYKQARIHAVRELRKHYQVQVHEERMLPDADPETVLLEGEGIRIKYADLLTLPDRQATKEWIEHHLFARAELLLTAQAAADAGIDVSAALASFQSERLPALLTEELEHQWLESDAPLKAYFESHPEIGQLLARRHIGQLVVATHQEAEQMRTRILAGESLFKLAGEYSIDPYGREHKGDMGWIKEDRGHPKINAAIASLKDGEVSEIVETPLGFHLVTILERKPGETRPFGLVRDKVQQMYLAEKLNSYLRELEQSYHVVWHVETKDNSAQY